MGQTLYVISDLHLGGDGAFAICGAEGQRLLANFLEWIAAEAKFGKDVHLIVNGDSVDFLAEEEFRAFTGDDPAASQKLQSIFDRNPAIWDGFAAVVKNGGQLTFTIGNHDVELALPGPRRLLERRLGNGRVRLLLGGESLHIGDVLIKHGNQYDRWNRVDHEGLARVRECLLRGEEPSGFVPPAGSRLVTEIMNPIKEKFSFINLLKPENQGAIPILGILNPSALGYIDEFVPLAVSAQMAEVDTEAVAAASAGGPAGSPRHPDDEEELRIAREMAYGDDTEQVGWVSDWFTSWSEARGEKKRRKQLERLQKVLNRWFDKHLLAFDTTLESPEYQDPATRAARDHGFRVIVYGHTHLAKRIPIAGTPAVYLNTGTWADLMCVPDSVLLPDLAEEGERQLALFAQDLKDNRLERWANRLPTFARIEMEGDRGRDARLLLWSGDGKSEEVPDGRLSRLLVKSAAAEGPKGV